MQTSILNLEVRKSFEATLKQPGQKPLVFSPFYVTQGWFVIGCKDMKTATKVQEHYKKNYPSVEIVNEYPYEIMAEWKKKEGKK